MKICIPLRVLYFQSLMLSKYGDLQNSQASVNGVFVFLPHVLHTKSLRLGRKKFRSETALIAFVISMVEQPKSLKSSVTDNPPFSSLSSDLHSLIILTAVSSDDNKFLPFNVSPWEYAGLPFC